jgi:predicted amidohydrolase YtcJ
MKDAWLGAAALAATLYTVSALAQDDACPQGRSISIVNGNIHTMDKDDRVVSSVFVRNGRFAAVGTAGEPAAGECHQTIDVAGRTVVPGVIDNHNHIVLLGLRPGHDTRIENARSIQEVLDTFAARARDRGIRSNEWLTALGGFNINQFTPPPAAPRMPTLAELDSVTRSHPVLIMQGFNGPTVTNSRGKSFFKGLGISVDDATGAIPSGTESVRALNALRALQTFDEQKRGLGYAMTYAAEVGVTTHLDQGGFHYSGLPIDSNNGVDALANFHPYRAHDSLRALYHEGKVFNRIWINFLHMEETAGTPQLEARLLNSWNDFGDDLVRVLGIGEFTAGNPFVPGSQVWFNGTRLVALARWRNENHSLGFPVGGIPDWKVIIDGWQSVHNEIAQDKSLGLPDGIKNLRWVLAHVPFIDREYLDRLHGLGGGISLVGGWRYISGGPTSNGPPFRMILDHKIRAGLSSDGMQISPMNPWLGMYYAVTGRNARGVLINDKQQITRKEALRLYTADNDWFLSLDGKIGAIEEGRFGDLIVLSADYFDPAKVSDEGIKDVHSVLTVVNGKVVHDNLDGRKPMYWNRESRARLKLN